ncbi:MAG: oxidoreductase family protein [Egibacteraceae bacterium]
MDEPACDCAAVAPPDRRTAFEAVAALLLPAEPARRGVIVEAAADWGPAEGLPVDVDVVVWGRPSLRGGTPPLVVLRSAAAREQALARLRWRAPAPLELVAVHRLAPPTNRPPSRVAHLRATLLSGVLVELAAPPQRPRVLDAVAAAAGAEGGVRRFRPGSGGQGLAEIALAGGVEAIIRAAPTGAAIGAVDPAHSGDGLEALAVVSAREVPRLLGRGHAAGASWTAESRLVGCRPRHLTCRLLADVTQFCAALPPCAEPPTALAADLERIATLLPDRGRAMRKLAVQVAPALEGMPSVLRHGDLWAGNLLCERGAITGIIDWDAWHPRGVPGADLVQLLGTEHRIRWHLALGAAWRERPWRMEEAARSNYWHALGLAPTTEALDLAGLAWWAAEVAGTLRRLPHRATDERWLALNVDPVLADLRP